MTKVLFLDTSPMMAYRDEGPLFVDLSAEPSSQLSDRLRRYLAVRARLGERRLTTP
jgi:hypothetical protein